ncbi:Hypothetical predicted protein [Octopus vulgaris]|uniref:Uncharacterized protein n=1 Tax=Octopus vulgaris TaxID=6645 RepID=A0AA36AX34_OCTVU|nr:Hypothetical predicted protein [Octopus vulgaris]
MRYLSHDMFAKTRKQVVNKLRVTGTRVQSVAMAMEKPVRITGVGPCKKRLSKPTLPDNIVDLTCHGISIECKPDPSNACIFELVGDILVPDCIRMFEHSGP